MMFIWLKTTFIKSPRCSKKWGMIKEVASFLDIPTAGVACLDLTDHGDVSQWSKGLNKAVKSWKTLPTTSCYTWYQVHIIFTACHVPTFIQCHSLWLEKTKWSSAILSMAVDPWVMIGPQMVVINSHPPSTFIIRKPSIAWAYKPLLDKLMYNLLMTSPAVETLSYL